MINNGFFQYNKHIKHKQWTRILTLGFYFFICIWCCITLCSDAEAQYSLGWTKKIDDVFFKTIDVLTDDNRWYINSDVIFGLGTFWGYTADASSSMHPHRKPYLFGDFSWWHAQRDLQIVHFVWAGAIEVRNILIKRKGFVPVFKTLFGWGCIRKVFGSDTYFQFNRNGLSMDSYLNHGDFTAWYISINPLSIKEFRIQTRGVWKVAVDVGCILLYSKLKGWF